MSIDLERFLVYYDGFPEYSLWEIRQHTGLIHKDFVARSGHDPEENRAYESIIGGLKNAERGEDWSAPERIAREAVAYSNRYS